MIQPPQKNPASITYSSQHLTEMADDDSQSSGLKGFFGSLFSKQGSPSLLSGFSPLGPSSFLLCFVFQPKEKKMEISAPTSFKHEIHVGYDPANGDFTGLPLEWKQLLENSGISREEQKKNPQVRGCQSPDHGDVRLTIFLFFLRKRLFWMSWTFTLRARDRQTCGQSSTTRMGHPQPKLPSSHRFHSSFSLHFLSHDPCKFITSAMCFP